MVKNLKKESASNNEQERFGSFIDEDVGEDDFDLDLLDD